MRTAVISREEILEASRALLREKGWSAVQMRSVAGRCGVAVGSLYNYFSSKSELAAATVESVWREIFGEPGKLADREQFCACVRWLYEQMREGNRRYPGFLTLHAMGFAAGDDKLEGRRMMEQVQGQLHQMLCGVLREDGQVRPDVFDECLTPERFVELVFSMLLSALLQEEENCEPLLTLVCRVLY